MESTEKIKSSSQLFIKKLAESISLDFPEFVTPIVKVVESEDLVLFYDNYGDTFDGMTIFDSDQFYIHINTFRGNRPDTQRARFTIAHELGHYFIDNHRVGLKRGHLTAHPSTNFESSSIIEREADYFASCLLMPEEKFKNFIHRKRFDFSLLKLLSESFQTSITATAIRYADIGNHPLMIVFGVNGKVKWKWYSQDFPFKYLLYGNSKIPEDSVMGEYFYENKIPKSTEMIWVIDWFNYIKKEDINRQLHEHCITHKNMALSILWE